MVPGADGSLTCSTGLADIMATMPELDDPHAPKYGSPPCRYVLRGLKRVYLCLWRQEHACGIVAVVAERRCTLFERVVHSSIHALRHSLQCVHACPPVQIVQMGLWEENRIVTINSSPHIATDPPSPLPPHPPPDVLRWSATH
jgi:hypothetical protein